MNRYETVFILTPVLSEQQTKETVGKYASLLKDEGAKVHHQEHWGLKKLAYPIEKKTTGFYHLLEFEAPGDAIAKLGLAFGRDERVIRNMTVKLDKHAEAWAEKRRSNAKNNKSKADEAEAKS